MRAAAKECGLDVTIDSAGTGAWHVGNPPDTRAQTEALRHGVDISALRARQVVAADFANFTHIFALDQENLDSLRTTAPPVSSAHISLLLDWINGREGQPVADPYYGETDGFAQTWADVSEATAAIARRLKRQYGA